MQTSRYFNKIKNDCNILKIGECFNFDFCPLFPWPRWGNVLKHGSVEDDYHPQSVLCCKLKSVFVIVVSKICRDNVFKVFLVQIMNTLNTFLKHIIEILFWFVKDCLFN